MFIVLPVVATLPLHVYSDELSKQMDSTTLKKHGSRRLPESAKFSLNAEAGNESSDSRNTTDTFLNN